MGGDGEEQEGRPERPVCRGGRVRAANRGRGLRSPMAPGATPPAPVPGPAPGRRHRRGDPGRGGFGQPAVPVLRRQRHPATRDRPDLPVGGRREVLDQCADRRPGLLARDRRRPFARPGPGSLRAGRSQVPVGTRQGPRARGAGGRRHLQLDHPCLPEWRRLLGAGGRSPVHEGWRPRPCREAGLRGGRWGVGARHGGERPPPQTRRLDHLHRVAGQIRHKRQVTRGRGVSRPGEAAPRSLLVHPGPPHLSVVRLRELEPAGADDDRPGDIPSIGQEAGGTGRHVHLRPSHPPRGADAPASGGARRPAQRRDRQARRQSLRRSSGLLRTSPDLHAPLPGAAGGRDGLRAAALRGHDLPGRADRGLGGDRSFRDLLGQSPAGRGRLLVRPWHRRRRHRDEGPAGGPSRGRGRSGRGLGPWGGAGQTPWSHQPPGPERSLGGPLAGDLDDGHRDRLPVPGGGLVRPTRDGGRPRPRPGGGGPGPMGGGRPGPGRGLAVRDPQSWISPLPDGWRRAEARRADPVVPDPVRGRGIRPGRAGDRSVPPRSPRGRAKPLPCRVPGHATGGGRAPDCAGPDLRHRTSHRDPRLRRHPHAFGRSHVERQGTGLPGERRIGHGGRGHPRAQPDPSGLHEGDRDRLGVLPPRSAAAGRAGCRSRDVRQGCILGPELRREATPEPSGGPDAVNRCGRSRSHPGGRGGAPDQRHAGVPGRAGPDRCEWSTC